MISVSIDNLDERLYRKLICYIIENSDEMSFQFPGYDSEGRPLTDEIWKDYHEKSRPLLNICFSQKGAKQSISGYYNGMRLGYYGKIVYVKPFEALKQMLLENHLFDWLVQNGLPEDICFYSRKKLRFFSCSHDEDFIVYNECKEDVVFFENNSIEFMITK